MKTALCRCCGSTEIIYLAPGSARIELAGMPDVRSTKASNARYSARGVRL